MRGDLSLLAHARAQRMGVRERYRSPKIAAGTRAPEGSAYDGDLEVSGQAVYN